jgi:hypothetical protein
LNSLEKGCGNLPEIRLEINDSNYPIYRLLRQTAVLCWLPLDTEYEIRPAAPAAWWASAYTNLF